MNWKVLLGLVFGYFVYLIIGAAIFSAIERPVEIDNCNSITARVNEFKRMLEENRANITVANVTVLAQVRVGIVELISARVRLCKG